MAEDTDKAIREFYQSRRWLVDPDMRTTMVTLSSGERVFVGDFVQLSNNRIASIQGFHLRNRIVVFRYHLFWRDINSFWENLLEEFVEPICKIRQHLQLYPFDEEAQRNYPDRTYFAGVCHGQHRERYVSFFN